MKENHEDIFTQQIREKVLNYEPEFDPKDWESMKDKLAGKEQKKILPIWYWTTGMAASIALIFSFTFLAPQSVGLQEPQQLTLKGSLFQEEAKDSKTAMKSTKQSSIVVTATASSKRIFEKKSQIQNVTAEVVTLKPNQSINSFWSKNSRNLNFQNSLFQKAENEVIPRSIIVKRTKNKAQSATAAYTSPLNKDDKNKVSILIGLSTIEPYNNHINKKTNVAASILSKIPLFKNLDIVTGIRLNKQEYSTVAPTNPSHSSYGRMVSTSSDASIMALEIPINLRYNFPTLGGINYYCSAGLSSLSNFNETYSHTQTSQTTYSQTQETPSEQPNNFGGTNNLVSEFISQNVTIDPAVDFEYDELESVTVTHINYIVKDNSERQTDPEVKNNTTIVKTVTTESSTTLKKKPFSTFDLARMLNISFGASYPLGSNHALAVEPFLRIPIGKFTSEDLSYAMGGISLAYSFGR